MSRHDLETQLHELTNQLGSELISLTPESMSEIQFEIVSTEDGGADIGLLENHPDVKYVALSSKVYDYAAQYVPLIRKYLPGWKRSLIVLKEANDGWEYCVHFES